MSVRSSIPPLRKLVQGPSARVVCFKEDGVSADGSVNTSTVARAGTVSA
jgi:hypothetical protein